MINMPVQTNVRVMVNAIFLPVSVCAIRVSRERTARSFIARKIALETASVTTRLLSASAMKSMLALIAPSWPVQMTATEMEIASTGRVGAPKNLVALTAESAIAQTNARSMELAP